jgi:hypothetical protein
MQLRHPFFHVTQLYVRFLLDHIDLLFEDIDLPDEFLSILGMIIGLSFNFQQ